MEEISIEIDERCHTCYEVCVSNHVPDVGVAQVALDDAEIRAAPVLDTTMILR